MSIRLTHNLANFGGLWKLRRYTMSFPYAEEFSLSGWGSAAKPKAAREALQFQSNRGRGGGSCRQAGRHASQRTEGEFPPRPVEMASLSRRPPTLPISHSLTVDWTKPSGPLRALSTVALSEPGIHSHGVTPGFSAGAPCSEEIQNRKI